MPFRTARGYRPRRRFRRRNRRVGAPLRRAPNWGRMMRVSQSLTRNVFWFKETGPIQLTNPGTNNDNGEIYSTYQPSDVTSNADFLNFARAFEQYKVLKVIVKLYPASIGSESVNPNVFRRGNIVSYIDQPPLGGQPDSINDAMGLPSAKLFQPRRFHKRFMNRPRGGNTFSWILINHTSTGAPAPLFDSWNTEIKIYGDNFGTGPAGTDQPYYFYEVLYKVIFRSRYSQD